MLRRTSFLFAFISAGAFAFCGQAKAEVSDVPFNANIAPKCTFSQILPGRLAPNSPQFMSGNGGLNGNVTIYCNTPATVIVADPVDNGTTGTTNFSRTAALAVNRSTGQIAGSPSLGAYGPSIAIAPIAPVSIFVNMGVWITEPAFKAGDYKLKVTLTSTP